MIKLLGSFLAAYVCYKIIVDMVNYVKEIENE